MNYEQWDNGQCITYNGRCMSKEGKREGGKRGEDKTKGINIEPMSNM